MKKLWHILTNSIDTMSEMGIIVLIKTKDTKNINIESVTTE
jgi:hypothetical protein